VTLEVCGERGIDGQMSPPFEPLASPLIGIAFSLYITPSLQKYENINQ